MSDPNAQHAAWLAQLDPEVAAELAKERQHQQAELDQVAAEQQSRKAPGM